VIRNDLDDNSILNTVSIKEPDAQKLVLAAAKARRKRLGTPVPKGAVGAEWRPHAPGVQKDYLMSRQFTQAEAIKLTCISQNFSDRRARAAHSDWQSLAR
jgi:hypothetical protein